PIANKEDSNCVYCNTINYSISSDTGICYGDSITLIVSGGSQYIWSTGSNSSLITVKPDSSETYSVYISDTTQCWDLATVVVTVYQSVKASFWTDQPSYSAGDSILFINSSAEATDFYWEFDDSINNTSVAEDPTHSYVSNGIKKVALIASNPCFSDTFYRTLNIFPASSIEDNLPPIFTSLRLYPNPGCSSLNIDLELSLDAHLEFCVIDIVGRKILIHESENAKGTHHYLLQDEISFIPQGIYIVQINILDKNSGEFIGSTNIKWVKTN
ncbi:MAG: T9SS type A sorting domain-containing protein, partial [Bacteroidetes bacterium]|nr:T9SS type A sorting domain-containing protein [Bacteroidota bacterium]